MKITTCTVGAFQENSYLVVDEETMHAVLIDPGAEPERLVAMVRASGARLDAIWLTHAHLDHIGGIAGVKRAFDVPVYLHPDDLPVFDLAPQSAALYGVPFETPPRPDAGLAEGDKMVVGSLSFDVLHTPGHAPGHVIFVGTGAMLGGDLLFSGSIGRTDLPFSNPGHMDASLGRLRDLEGALVVHPGHGSLTTLRHELTNNIFLNGAVPIART